MAYLIYCQNWSRGWQRVCAKYAVFHQFYPSTVKKSEFTLSLAPPIHPPFCPSPGVRMITREVYCILTATFLMARTYTFHGYLIFTQRVEGDWCVWHPKNHFQVGSFIFHKLVAKKTINIYNQYTVQLSKETRDDFVFATWAGPTRLIIVWNDVTWHTE